jgi:hypothetical protein
MTTLGSAAMNAAAAASPWPARKDSAAWILVTPSKDGMSADPTTPHTLEPCMNRQIDMMSVSHASYTKRMFKVEHGNNALKYKPSYL